MFVGHYGPGFAIRAVRPEVPLWVLFVAAQLWSGAAAVVCRAVFRWRRWSSAAWVGVAVLSHWVLDWLLHRPDLPLFGNSMKVGLGLWNHVALSLGLELLVLGGGLWLYLTKTRAISTVGRYGPGHVRAGDAGSADRVAAGAAAAVSGDGGGERTWRLCRVRGGGGLD